MSAAYDLVELVARYADDPLGYSRVMYPWGEGDFNGSEGPREWQADILNSIKNHLQSENKFQPLKIAVASGRGIGKSALIGMVCQWAMSTCVDTKIVVTANTDRQLRTKTWPEISKWFRRAANGHWFRSTATTIVSTFDGHEDSWRADAYPWSINSTESFQGLHNMNRRIVLIFDEACHDKDTEVLTENGWRYFSELTGNEKLLTINPETRMAEYIRPSHLHISYKSGEMIRYKRRGLSFAVTPNHRMFISTRFKNNFFRTAGELANTKHTEVNIERGFNWGISDVPTIKIPALSGNKKNWSEKEYNADDFAELLGWYCSEGHLTYSNGLYRTVGISQLDTKVIESVCDRLGIHYKVYQCSNVKQVRIHCTQLAEWLAQFGIGSLNIRVPDIIKKLSSRQINIFLNAYRDGDGYKKTKSVDVFYTSSKNMADDLQELCFMAGQNSTVMKRPLAGKLIKFKTHDAVSSVDGYVVSRCYTKSSAKIKTKYLEKYHYDGMVYCATLPKHGLLFTRRDGVCLWSGNSGVDDKIWDVSEGSLTDENTEMIWIAFSNPTRNSGRFRECFGRFKHRWLTRQIDSRTVEGTNKDFFKQLVDDNGEDSDYVRVHVKGEFPRVGSMQFISSEIVDAARKREATATLSDPLIMGVDVGRFGDDPSCIVFRRGRDARSIPEEYLRGVDTMTLAARVMELQQQHRPDAIMVDGGGVGGGVVDRLMMLKQNVIEVQFGGKPDRGSMTREGAVVYANKRSEIWGYMRDWLPTGSIPDVSACGDELTGVQYGYVFRDGKDAIQLEKKADMKARGLASPNWADALALTFSYPVMPSDHSAQISGHGNASHQIEYDAFSRDRVRGME